MPTQTKEGPTAAERQEDYCALARSRRWGLRDEVLRLRQQLEVTLF
jgi:hypothetical protein